MTLTAVPFHSYIEKVNEGVISWAHNFKVALLNTAPTAASDTVWADVSGDEITGSGYTSGGAAVTIGDSSQSSGTFTATASGNVSWTATGTWTAFRYIVLVDVDATGDALCCYWDYGSNISLRNSGQFNFNVNGVALVTKAPS